MQLLTLLPFTFAVLASAVNGKPASPPVPPPYALVFTHEEFKGSAGFVAHQCTPLGLLHIGSIYIPAFKDFPMKCILFSDEKCAIGSVVISYAASQESIPTTVSDQTVAARCYYN